MAKDIFSKIVKDYNNELEEILEKKAFSEDVKNLLLSMLYKIENSYEDYKKTKVNVCTKKQFVKEILETIKNNCNEIEIVKPLTEEGKKFYDEQIDCIVDKENGKIKTFQNEKSILDAILKIRQQEINILEEYDLYKEPIIEMLSIGNSMNSLEVIRDFNGWSWDITIKNYKEEIYNKIYQLITILLGNKELDTWLNNRKIEEQEEVPSNVILSSKYNESFGITKEEIQGERKDYLKELILKFETLYGEELTKTFIEELVKLLIIVCSKYNKEYKDKIEEKINELEEKYEEMNDNKVFLESLSKEKREINKKIKEIDTILTDEKTLKEEYQKRNEKLPNKEKIFSVSHLRLMLEKQRNNYLEEIKKINKNMEPKEFVKIKSELEKNILFYKDIKIEDLSKKNIERLQTKLEEEFLKCFTKKIERAEEKKQIEDLIYEIRYYKLILPNINSTNINSNYNKILEKVEKQLIQKACEEKVLVRFSEDEELNYKILKNILETKIIDIDQIVYVVKYNKGILTINIYDGNIEDTQVQIEIKEKTELSVKLNKKIKLKG